MLQHLRDDLRLYHRNRFSLSVIVYSLSRQVLPFLLLNNLTFLRFTCLAYVTSKVIFLSTSPFPPVFAILNRYTAKANVDCTTLERAAVATYCVGHALTALLFFFRATAVYNNSKTSRVVFGFSWFCVAAGTLSTINAIHGRMIHLGDGYYCMATYISSQITVTVFTTFINDTLIYLAIGYKLSLNNAGAPETEGYRNVFLWGRSWSAFSKALLQENQIYYLSVVRISDLIPLISS